MSYSKHNFEDGEVLHAESLNDMDDAIESLDSVVGDAIVLESNEEVSSHRVVEESDLVLYATKAYVDGLIGNLDTLIGTGVIE